MMSSITNALHRNNVSVLSTLMILSKNLVYGGIATIGLLYAMQLLISQDFPEVNDEPRRPIPSFFMEIPTDIKIELEQPPVRPVVVTPPTKIIVDPPAINPGIAEPGIHIGPITSAKPPVNVLPQLDGQMMPFVKVAPEYPTNAAIKGIEGYVDVMFDVTEIGTTTNIRIVSFVPSTIFNKSVIKSIKGWKYKPTIVDGVPVKSFDIKERIRFNLNKE